MENKMTNYINAVRTEKQKIRDEKIQRIKDNLAFGAFGLFTTILFLNAFNFQKAEAAIIIEPTITQPACVEFKNVQELDKIVDDLIDPQYTKSTDDYFRTIYINNKTDLNVVNKPITESEFNLIKTTYKNKIMMNHCDLKGFK